jgi:hypothetical protein
LRELKDFRDLTDSESLNYGELQDLLMFGRESRKCLPHLLAGGNLLG